MKKAIKLASIATAVVAAGVIGATAVSAWGDSAGGRQTYTIKQINDGVLGDKIVLNSIKDNQKDMPLTDERNFVGARDASTGNKGAQNVWQGNEITVEEGKTYLVRIYVHNNNPNGEKAVAKGVTTSFSLPTVVSKEQRVDGYITASNATPNKYWDSVVFKSNRNFYLDYVEGSALLENNGIGKNGVKLSDAIVTNGVKIGFNALNGEVPGCYNYDNFVTIKVKPVFESTEIQKTVRKMSDSKFSEKVTATVGETVEFQIAYKNTNASTMKDVMIVDSLPNNLEYVKGSTVIYNANHKDGAAIKTDTIVTTGLNIGDYKVGTNAYIRFQAVVKDKSLSCGDNRLINWAKATNKVGTSTKVSAFAVQDSAEVDVAKKCDTPTPQTYKCKKVNGKYYGKNGNVVSYEQYKKECLAPIPQTGATDIMIGALGLGGVITTAGYYIASRKQLR